MCHAEVIIASV